MTDERSGQDQVAVDFSADCVEATGEIDGMLAERTCIGTPKQAIGRIEAWRDMGFSEISSVVRTGTLGHDAATRTMRRFNEAVLPVFAGVRASAE